jgi:hypothetical protein
MYEHPVTDRDHGEFTERGLRELTKDEAALVGGGNHGVIGGGRFGGCPLPNDYRLGPFCTN